MRELAQNLQKASDTITGAINNTGASVYTIANAMDELLRQFSTSKSGLEQVQYNASAKTTNTKGFASGTRRVGKSVTALTMEDGREIVITKDGILTQLQPNDAVMNNKLTEQFFEAAKNYPVMEKMYRKIGNFEMGDVPSAQTIAPVVNYSPVINNANMSEQQVQELLEKDRPKATQYVINEIRKDMRKSGR